MFSCQTPNLYAAQTIHPQNTMPQGVIPFPFGQCRVCNDKATGVHYGVATCEGCKGFYKRSISKGEKYRCYFGERCIISPENRNRCKSCRFKKCLEQGMAVEAVKMGRIPKVEKEKALEEAAAAQTEGDVDEYQERHASLSEGGLASTKTLCSTGRSGLSGSLPLSAIGDLGIQRNLSTGIGGLSGCSTVSMIEPHLSSSMHDNSTFPIELCRGGYAGEQAGAKRIKKEMLDSQFPEDGFRSSSPVQGSSSNQLCFQPLRHRLGRPASGSETSANGMQQYLQPSSSTGAELASVLERPHQQRPYSYTGLETGHIGQENSAKPRVCQSEAHFEGNRKSLPQLVASGDNTLRSESSTIDINSIPLFPHGPAASNNNKAPQHASIIDNYGQSADGTAHSWYTFPNPGSGSVETNGHPRPSMDSTDASGESQNGCVVTHRSPSLGPHSLFDISSGTNDIKTEPLNRVLSSGRFSALGNEQQDCSGSSATPGLSSATPGLSSPLCSSMSDCGSRGSTPGVRQVEGSGKCNKRLIKVLLHQVMTEEGGANREKLLQKLVRSCSQESLHTNLDLLQEVASSSPSHDDSSIFFGAFGDTTTSCADVNNRVHTSFDVDGRISCAGKENSPASFHLGNNHAVVFANNRSMSSLGLHSLQDSNAHGSARQDRSFHCDTNKIQCLHQRLQPSTVTPSIFPDAPSPSLGQVHQHRQGHQLHVAAHSHSISSRPVPASAAPTVQQDYFAPSSGNLLDAFSTPTPSRKDSLPSSSSNDGDSTQSHPVSSIPARRFSLDCIPDVSSLEVMHSEDSLEVIQPDTFPVLDLPISEDTDSCSLDMNYLCQEQLRNVDESNASSIQSPLSSRSDCSQASPAAYLADPQMKDIVELLEKSYEEIFQLTHKRTLRDKFVKIKRANPTASVPPTATTVEEMYKYLIDSIAVCSQKIIKFCQTAPGYMTLDSDDREILLKRAYYDIWMITNSEFFLDGESYLHVCEGIFYVRRYMEQIIGKDNTHVLHLFSEQFNALGLSNLEMAILCCIQLTAPGHDEASNLKNVKEIQKLNSLYLDLLVALVTHMHSDSCSRVLVDIFRLVPLLTEVNHLQRNIIGNFSTEQLPTEAQLQKPVNAKVKALS